VACSFVRYDGQWLFSVRTLKHDAHKKNHKHRTHLKKLWGLKYWLDKKLEQISIICSPDVNYIWEPKTAGVGLWSSWTGSAFIWTPCTIDLNHQKGFLIYLFIIMLRKAWINKFFWIDFTGQGRGRKIPLLKFRVILIVLTLLHLNTTTKLPYHPPRLRRRD